MQDGEIKKVCAHARRRVLQIGYKGTAIRQLDGTNGSVLKVRYGNAL